MSLGYFGYAKLANIFLLTNSGGLNRRIEPIRSDAVWGAGWYTGAGLTNYADNQQNFEGSITFELQGIPSVWNLVTNWLINQRVTPQSLIVSPNGLVVQSYIANPADPRTGAWLNSAGITIDAEASIKLNCNVMSLLRTETYSANTYRTVRVGPGIPTAPMNPSPYNRNPFPGWSAQAVIGWPGSPSAFSQANPTGMFMMGADATFNNNTQVIRGCLSVDSRVLTSRGYERIGDIPDEPHRVLSEHGIQNAQGIVYRGTEPYVRVRTKLGNDVKVSLDHRFRVMRGDGTLGWKAARDLGVGDYLLCQRGHGGLIPEDRGGSVKHWYAIGHLYGDGYMHKSELCWQVAEHERELEGVLYDFFASEGIQYREDFREPSEHGGVERNETINHFIVSRNYPNFRCLPPYAPKGSWRASGFPEEVWNLGERQLGAFLRGLFSTDGSVGEHCEINITSKYRLMAKDIRRALGLLGILSTIRKRARRTPFGITREWSVTVVGARSKSSFRDKVGFAVSWKQDRLEWYLNSRERERGCKSCFIPYSSIILRSIFPTGHWLKTKDKKELSTTEGISRVFRINANLSESMVPRVIDRAERLNKSGPELQLLKMYQAQGWYFDPVEKITPGLKDIPVYTVYQSASHSYMGEGMIHANCTGLPNPAAIMQGVMTVEGTVRLFRDGTIPDPYSIPNTPFTASGASLMMNIGIVNPIPQINLPSILLTSEEFTIQGQNTPVPRTFGFAGVGDGTRPPMLMPSLS